MQYGQCSGTPLNTRLRSTSTFFDVLELTSTNKVIEHAISSVLHFQLGFRRLRAVENWSPLPLWTNISITGQTGASACVLQASCKREEYFRTTTCLRPPRLRWHAARAAAKQEQGRTPKLGVCTTASNLLCSFQNASQRTLSRCKASHAI